MTPEEAAHECIEFSLTFGGLEKEEFRLNIAKLRELGYVIIPVTPSGETLELASRAICVSEKMNDDDVLGGWIHWEDATRAAYAAIVGGDE